MFNQHSRKVALILAAIGTLMLLQYQTPHVSAADWDLVTKFDDHSNVFEVGPCGIGDEIRDNQQIGAQVVVDASGQTAVASSRYDGCEEHPGGFAFSSGTSGGWSVNQRIPATGAAARSLAMDSAGTTLYVGRPTDDCAAGTDCGAVEVLRRQANGSWLADASSRLTGHSADDRFGTSVALSSDGTVLAVGAVNAEHSTDGWDPGVVYIYRWSEAAEAWELGDSIDYPGAFSTQYVGNFGWRLAVSADGDTLIAKAQSTGFGRGSAYFFGYHAGAWQQEHVVTYRGPGPVALSHDGSSGFVGVPGADLGWGLVSTWARSATDGTWTWTGNLDREGPTPFDNSGGHFGTSIATDASGALLVVGDPRARMPVCVSGDGPFRKGAVRVYELDSGSWSMTATVHGCDPLEEFGSSVALTPNGETLVVGAPSNDGGGGHEAVGFHPISIEPSGAVYIFDGLFNAPPVADPGGPYSVDEGGTVSLDGSQSTDPDPEDTVAAYEWDLAYDGATFDVDAVGPAPTFDAVALDGPDIATVALRVTDTNGATSEAVTAQITIENVAPTVLNVDGPVDPLSVDTDMPVRVAATFEDPAGTLDSPYTCLVDYGDGTVPQPGSVVDTACSGADHSYTSAGVYTVEVTVTDKDGAVSDSRSDQYVVVFNQDGGFVAGGGWIDSPAGALTANPNLTGKAHFGFVSKYKKGATQPSGSTRFEFTAAGLVFKSTKYDWLVVAGHDKAKYKGTGTVNGVGSYGFMLTAIDGAAAGDELHIKIWDALGVVYDNRPDASDDEYAGTVIGGGNIQVHAK